MPDLKTMKYADLRKLAKEAGIKANQKQEKLVAELTKFYEKMQKSKTPVTKKTDSKPATPLSKPGTPVMMKVNTPVISKLKPATPASKTPVVKKVNTPIAKKGNTPVTSKLTPKVGKTNTPIVSKTATPKITKPSTPAVQKPSTPATSGSKKPVTPKPATQAVATPGSTKSRWERKEFASASKPGTPLNRSGTKRKSTDSPSQASPAKKRRSTFEKAPTPNLASPHVASPAERRASRRSSSGSSPGVKEMLSKLNNDMNDEEMKASLMSAIDERVKEKVKASNSGTGIPRFVAFAKKKKAESKPVTPGSKNWEKIHKKNFEKFDSIDVYLNKKRKRAEDMSASVKKARTLLEEVHTVANKLKSHKTPQANENKFKKPRLSSANKTTPFKPTVLNTTRMNLNFGAKKPSPKTLPRKSPASVISDQEKMMSNKSATKTRKSAGSIMQRKSTATPFKFTAPILPSTLNKTVGSTKKVFDLQASLARPLTYRPHTGKLKPIDQYSVKSPAANKAASAAKSVTNRVSARAKVTQRRANKKDEAKMARRGINV